MQQLCPDQRQSLLAFRAEHEAMVKTQRGLQESLTQLCSQLNSVSAQNISLHRALIELRRDHRALRSQHGAVIEQLHTVCMLNEELEARVQVQAQLLGSVRSAAQFGHGPYLAVHGDAPGNMCDLELAASLGQLLHYELPTAAGMAGGGTAATGARAHSVAPGQEDGNDDEEDAVGGLDLIMEAVEQMESEGKDSASQPLSDGDAAAAGRPRLSASGHAARPSALRQHSETSTSEHAGLALGNAGSVSGGQLLPTASLLLQRGLSSTLDARASGAWAEAAFAAPKATGRRRGGGDGVAPARVPKAKATKRRRVGK